MAKLNVSAETKGKRKSEDTGGDNTPLGPIAAQRKARESRLDELARRINAEHAAVEAATAVFLKEGVKRALGVGELLAEAKHRAGHGNWLPWLATNCPKISERTAQVYLRLSKNREFIEAQIRSSADLTIDGALKLLAGRAATQQPNGASGGTESETETETEAAAPASALPDLPACLDRRSSTAKPEGEALAHIEGIGTPVLINGTPAAETVLPSKLAAAAPANLDNPDVLKAEAWRDLVAAVRLIVNLPTQRKAFASPISPAIDGCPSSIEFNEIRGDINRAGKLLDEVVKIVRRIPKAKQWGAS
jgi:hypothetical protein